ncbi:MAG TPA: hypothetical protein VHB79_33980 [Polyangiaceae bacterium]|nr:hypothetical protein [Polyangiaceae bacterium]
MTKKFALAVPVLTLLSLTAGCKQEPECPALDSCGGPDPVGAWVLGPGYPSCEEDLFIPPTDLRLAQNNKTPAGTAPPEPANFDWCDQLVAGGGSMIQLKDPVFFYDSAPVASSSVKFSRDPMTGAQTFTASVTNTGVFYMDFPAACVRQYGATDGKLINPDDPTAGTGNVCKQLEYPINQGGTNSGAYFNTVCDVNPNDPGGCLCHFDVKSTSGPAGDWIRTGNTIEFITTNAVPSYVTFCNKGTELDLTGKNGDYLFGVKGLRTVKLQAGAL